VLTWGDLLLDTVRHELMCGGRPVALTPTEFQLLQTLLESPGQAFTRSQLIERALGHDYGGYERTLDSHVRNLRKKIEPPGDRPVYIETVYGIGYRLAGPAAPERGPTP
jgi:two-component system alkaline phosphatase synthesis response regulator PhoP